MASCCPPGSLGPASPLSSQTTTLKGRMEMIQPPDDYFDLMNEIQPMPCYCTTGSTAAAAAEPATESADPSSSDPSSLSLWKSTNRVVIIFTDVFGLDSGNHKVFADALAERLNRNNNKATAATTATTTTTTVVVPDIFRGKPIAHYDSKIPVIVQIVWKMVIGFDANAYDKDLTHLILPWLRRKMNHDNSHDSNKNNDNISCVGFCFGGWRVARALALSNESENNTNNDSKDELFPMKCGIGIHPALKPEAWEQHGQAQLARRMGTKPVLWLSAGNDELKPGGQHLVVQINAQARNVAETDVAIEFPEMVHGWVSRGDATTNPIIAKEQERALQLTIDFINKHCPV